MSVSTVTHATAAINGPSLVSIVADEPTASKPVLVRAHRRAVAQRNMIPALLPVGDKYTVKLRTDGDWFVYARTNSIRRAKSLIVGLAAAGIEGAIMQDGHYVFSRIAGTVGFGSLFGNVRMNAAF